MITDNRTQKAIEHETLELTVIIPTLADDKREKTLIRAINSITKQTDCPAKVIVVVNGQRFDSKLLDILAARADIEVLREPRASAKIARYTGLLNVKTPYFAFLDDDDELLEHSNKTRLDTLKTHPNCAFVVSGGYRIEAGIQKPSAQNIVRARTAPYEELSENNWLTSCGCIFATNMIQPDIFRDLPDYHEWTYLAYKLLSCSSFCITEMPCYIIHESTNSLSKTLEYSIAHVGVFRRVLSLDIPESAKTEVKRRLAKAEHDSASLALSAGLVQKALKHHLASLVLPGGLRYLSFTRHLLKPSKQKVQNKRP